MKEYVTFLRQMTGGICKDFKRIWLLAVFDYNMSTKGMFFGSLWQLISPFIQIGTYWLVFGLGLRSGSPIDGIPYIVWLTCGVTPWYIISGGVGPVANSIYSNATTLTRSNIPSYVLPISAVVSKMLAGCWTIGLMLVIYLANGCRPGWSALGLIYYVLCIAAFLSALSLVTTVLVMLARDFQQVIQMAMRLLFFLSPVFWKPGQNMPTPFLVFDQVNPIGYIIRGFRDSLLYHTPWYGTVQTAVSFWVVVAVLYLLGAAFQMKLRKNILDFL